MSVPPNYRNFPKLALNPEAYKPTQEDLVYLKKLTGIQDEDLLEEHVLKVQAEAFSIYPFPCIGLFQFITSRIASHPAYHDIFKLGKERKGAIYLELACCFGNDARRLIADGYPMENVVLSDLQPEYGELGHKLYRTTPETFPVPFVAGDVFNPAFLSSDETSNTLPPLTSLKTLSPLIGQVSIIHAAFFFHLFDEKQQRDLANRVYKLLTPIPGSMILGSNMGLPDADDNRNGGLRWSRTGKSIFAHSPTSWATMWKNIFGEGNVRIESWVKKNTNFRPESPMYLHVWKITRL
ncbi:hypothetical protein M422DRAFT_36974 [Sphaerobolus stellatus SS14]|uniref:Methyltransferase domain-containing protein n=1 Tax=Sphaerobolus stellatus (strain SS14) TaxID=990650 RepID=A0A0C9UKB2_SPHS4|nr:hypothetical protein M422DRAFT_36974 [Sphaerobolus stellatus SS14]